MLPVRIEGLIVLDYIIGVGYLLQQLNQGLLCLLLYLLSSHHFVRDILLHTFQHLFRRIPQVIPQLLYFNLLLLRLLISFSIPSPDLINEIPNCTSHLLKFSFLPSLICTDLEEKGVQE